MEIQHVIGVAGLPRSGKGTVIKILKTIFGESAHILSSSAILEGLLRDIGVPNPADRSAKQRGFIELARRFGNEWLLTALINQWNAGGKNIWIFDGVCMPWDTAYIQSHTQSTLFYISAPFELRLKRARQAAARGEHMAKPDEIAITEEQFQKLHEHETTRHIKEFQSLPNVAVLENTGTIRNLGSQITTALVNTQMIQPDTLVPCRAALEELYKQFESQ